ncbi:hypothetical protein QJQ45_002352 [Haematococcus lacustris]|nr:hypothetical protein QJQ45_002352 [Haematococcus lacustris]
MLKHMQEWHAANNTVLSCSQFVKAELRLPGVTVPCQLNVMPSLLPDFDVLLGNDWLNEHEAVMSYQDKTLSLACDKSEPVVLPCPSAGVSQSGQSAVSNPASFLVNALRAKPPLASAKVAARWLRKGGTGVLALITVDNSSTPDPAPAEPDLPPGVSQALNALLDEYADVFAPITSLPPERPVGHAIPLVPDARPSVVPQYRMSQDEHAELKKQVQDLLAKGMIEPSSSPFAAPILFVKKKSGELRMCLDYRQLNKITIRDQYPLPRIDDLFDKLSGCTVFSSLDLQAGYNQIGITPEDVPKTAFRTPDGHYQFKVLSFGLCNAPATFQRVMNDAFAPVLNQCALVYLDDILVMSKSVDEHLKHLRKVFDLLRLNKLFAKQSKCEFMRTTLKFLGHVIFAGAIAVDPEKIKSISSWPVPQSLQQLQSFLGAANFVRKFVHNFSVLAAPLTDLCGKAGDSFLWHNWPADELKAFASLKAAVAQVPMLRLPDHTQPFQVYCDASLQGVGAVLMQDGYPLAYLSKKLSSAERNYTTGEQELLALITACKEWRCYLEGVPFTLFTDHKPLTALPTQKVLSRRQARWMEFLSRFTFDLQYLPGDANPADPLSRIPAGPQDCAMVCVVTTRRQAKQSLERGEVRVAQALPQVPPVGTPSNAPTAVDALAPRPTVSDNPVAAHHSRLPELEAPSAADTSVHYPAAPAHPLELADHLVHGYRLDPAFTAEADLSGMYMDDHGLWRRTGKGTVMVPNDPELREYILHEMHDAAYAGHVGITKTLERLSRVFYWDTMRADVRHYVTTCDACQRDKSSTLKPGGLLNPLSIPDYRWESVSMDLITKLPSASHGFDAICVFVDRLSKMVHFVPCKESMNAKGFARLFVDNVFKLHGLPKDMVSDRGPHFHNTFWHHVLDVGTTVNLLGAYGRMDDLLVFAQVGSGRVGGASRALAVLRKPSCAPALTYRFAPALVAAAPQETVDHLIAARPPLEPRLLIPALLRFVEPGASAAGRAAVLRYVEYALEVLKSQDKAVHNLAAALHTLADSEAGLLSYLARAHTASGRPLYDLKYVLRMAMERNKPRAAVKLLCKLGMYEDAVSKALAVDLALSKEVAMAPPGEEEEGLRRRLWLAIAQHVVQQAVLAVGVQHALYAHCACYEQGGASSHGPAAQAAAIKQAVEFLKEAGGLLKIEDVLPFFPDFVTIDNFKEAICDSLERYNRQIEVLKCEMEESTEIADAVRADLAVLATRTATVSLAAPCARCGRPLANTPPDSAIGTLPAGGAMPSFLVFPSGLVYHGSCCAAEVCELAAPIIKQRVISAAGKLGRRHKGDESAQVLLGQLLDDIGAEDPRNGELVVRLVDAPYLLPADNAESATWII